MKPCLLPRLQKQKNFLQKYAIHLKRKNNFIKKIFPLLVLFGAVAVSFSQTPDSVKLWKKGGTGTLNFSQTSFSNWAAGGENSLSATALFNLFSNYKKDKTTWDNTLDVAYGFLQTGSAPLRKSDDKIDFTSKYGHKTSNKWALAALVNFKSQFTQGYNYPNDSVAISDFLAPAYILVSTGMDYKPVDYFSFFASPATGKITIVNNQKLADAGAFGVQKALFDSLGVQTASGKKIRYEFGALISMKFKKEIVKNIMLSTKADFFSNYFHDPQNIDLSWDFLLNMKVNKFVSASISTTLVYDHDIPVPIYKDVAGTKTQIGTGPRTQFKEVFAIGFSYKI